VPNFVGDSKGPNVYFPTGTIFLTTSSSFGGRPCFESGRRYPYGMSKTRKFEKVGLYSLLQCSSRRSAMISLHPQFLRMRDKEATSSSMAGPPGNSIGGLAGAVLDHFQKWRRGTIVSILRSGEREAVIENRAPKKEYALSMGLESARGTDPGCRGEECPSGPHDRTPKVSHAVSHSITLPSARSHRSLWGGNDMAVERMNRVDFRPLAKKQDDFTSTRRGLHSLQSSRNRMRQVGEDVDEHPRNCGVAHRRHNFGSLRKIGQPA